MTNTVTVRRKIYFLNTSHCTKNSRDVTVKTSDVVTSVVVSSVMVTSAMVTSLKHSLIKLYSVTKRVFNFSLKVSTFLRGSLLHELPMTPHGKRRNTRFISWKLCSFNAARDQITWYHTVFNSTKLNVSKQKLFLGLKTKTAWVDSQRKSRLHANTGCNLKPEKRLWQVTQQTVGNRQQ